MKKIFTLLFLSAIYIQNINAQANAGPDQNICSDSTYMQAVNPFPNSGIWTVVSGTGTFANPTIYNTQVMDIGPLTNEYRWEVTIGLDVFQDIVNITNNEVFALATDQITCDNTAVFNGNNPGGATGLWTVVGSSGTPSIDDPNLNISHVTNLGYGINTFRWLVENATGCKDSIDIQINNGYFTISAGTDQAVCSTSGILGGEEPGNGNPGISGTWTTVAGGPHIFSDNTVFNSNVNGLTPGDNIFRWVVNSAICSTFDEVTIRNNNPTNAIILFPIPANREICTNTVTVEGSNPVIGSGQWTISSWGANIVSPNNFQTVINNLEPGYNFVTWTITNGICSDNDVIVITNNEVVSMAGPDKTTVCNDFTTLTGNNPLLTQGSGIWTDQSGSSAVIANNNLFNTLVNSIEPGTTTFRWTVSLGSCSEFDEVVITNNQISASAGADIETCNNFYYPLDGNDVSIAGGTGNWSTTGPATFADPTLYNTQVNNLSWGFNNLIWTVTSLVEGCIDFDEVIVIYNGVTSNAGTNFETCDANIILSAVAPVIGTGIWTQTGGAPSTIVDATNRQTGVTGLTGGFYHYTWTVSNGLCTAVDDVLITNSSPDDFTIESDKEVCTNNSTLTVNPAPIIGTGTWSIFAAGIFTTIIDPTNIHTTVTNLQPGNNIFLWTVSNGFCLKQDNLVITNNHVIANAGFDQTVCGDSYTLAAIDPSTYEPGLGSGIWTYVGLPCPLIEDPSSFSSPVSLLNPGLNKFRWTLTEGSCSDDDEVDIYFNPISEANAGPDTIVCQDFLNLYAEEPSSGTGFWRVISGGAIITNPTAFNSEVTNLDDYCSPWNPDWQNDVNSVNVFEWAVTNNGCESTDQVSVLNGLPEPPDAGIDQIVCENVVNLDALDEGSCTQSTWWEEMPNTGDFYDPETGLPIADYFEGVLPDPVNMPLNIHVEDIQNGMTRFVWHKKNEYQYSDGTWFKCELTDTAEITSLGDFEDVQAGTNDATCENWYLLDATDPESIFNTPPHSYNTSAVWSVTFGNGNFDDPTFYNTTVRNMGAQTNIYRWTITNHDLGCVMSDDVYIYSGRPSDATAGPDKVTCDTFAILSANVPARFTNAYWQLLSGTASILNNSCTSFACDALAINLYYGPNVFLWTVENTYTGPYGGYSVANPLLCTLTDTLVITNSSVTAVAGNDIYICADTAQLNANLPAGSTGLWLAAGTTTFASTGGITSTVYNDVARNLSRGKNTFLWTITRGFCSDTDQLIVWNNLPAPNPNAGADQIICSDETVLASNTITRNDTWYDITGSIVTQEGYSSQEWSVGLGTGTFDNPSVTNTRVRNVSPAENEYEWNAYYHFTDYRYETGIPGVYGTYHQTCRLTDTVNIYNNSVTSEAGMDDFVCGIQGPGASINLNADNSQAGVWIPVFNPGPSNIVTPTAYNTLVTNMQNGDHIYRWVVSSTYNTVTCTGTDEVTVQIRIPTTSVVANPSSFEVCVNQAPLVANNPLFGIGTWSVASATPGTIDDPTGNVTFVDLIQNGTSQWQWTINYDGCISKDTITIQNNTVYADADLALNPNFIDICSPNYALNATDPNIFNVSNPLADGTWSANLGITTFDDNKAYNTTAHNLSSLLPNTLTWTIIKGGCNAWDQLFINNNEFTIDASVSSNPNALESCDGTMVLDGEQVGSGGSGLWTYVSGSGGNIINPTLFNTVVNTIIPGGTSLFRWTVTSVDACTANDVVTVTNNQVTANAGSDQATCDGTLAFMPASDPGPGITGNWQLIFGSGLITDPTLYNSSVSGLNPNTNTFRWNVARSICTDFDDVVIVNNEPADFIIETDKETCDGNSSISVNIFPPNGTGVWTQTSGSGTIVDPLNINTIVNGLEPGINTYRWRVTNVGCTKEDFITVTNNQVFANAGSDQTIYTINNTTNFNAVLESDETGTWSLLFGSGTIENYNDPNSLVSDLSNGDNVFRWLVENIQCSAYDDVTITLTDFVPFAGSDQIVCSDTAKLNATHVTGADDQKWSIVSGAGQFDDIYNPKTVVRNILWGANIYRWTVYFPGYSDYDDVVVTSDSIFVSAGEDASVCGDTYQMDAQYIQGALHLWTPIGLGGGTIENSTAWNTLVTNLPIGQNVFNWFVDNGNCQSNDIVIIERKAEPIADFTVTPSESCPPVNVLMDNISDFTPGFTPPDEFQWFVNGAFLGTTYSVDDNVNHLFTNTAQTDSTYTVNMIAYDYETSCIDTATQIVLVFAMPHVDFDLDPHVTEFPNATIEIENLSDPDLELYYWEFGDGNFISQTEWVNVIAHTYATWGTFYVTLTGTSDISCEAQYTDSVIILEANSVSDITSEYNLYPNPADNLITLSSSNNLNNVVIEIENTSGQNVYRSMLNQNKKEYEIDISALADGFYVLKISSGNQIKLMKFVKK